MPREWWTIDGLRAWSFRELRPGFGLQPGGGERSRAGRPLTVTDMVKDDAELFRKFIDNEGFKRWMNRPGVRAVVRAGRRAMA